MSENQSNAAESGESKEPVNIQDYEKSPAQAVREQAKRVQERKARTADLIDSIWDQGSTEVKAETQQKEPEANVREERGKYEPVEDVTDGAEGDRRSLNDVIDEAWEATQQGSEEPEAEEAESSSEEESSEEPVEEAEVEVEEETEAVRDDVILATVESEDGESEVLEIPKDAKLKIKVNGEEQEISLQEFANGISGEKAIAQKFSALDAEQKAFQQQSAAWAESISEARGMLKEGRVVEGIQLVAEREGLDPQLLFTSLFEEITPILNDYANLSEPEREKWSQEIRNKKAEFQARSAQDELNKLRAAQEQQVKVKNVQETYGLDDAAFTYAYHALEAEMEAGTLQKQVITPELVGEYSRLVTIEGYATNALAGTEYEGDQTAISQVLQAVNQMARQGTEITEQVVEELVANALGRQQQVKKSKAVTEKLKKTGVQPSTNKGKPLKKVNRSNPQDKPKHWMESALEELENGASASDLGLTSRKRK